MLKHLRNHSKIVIWAVVLTFMLWGGFSVGASFRSKGRYAGELNGKKITFQEWDTFYKSTQIFGSGSRDALQDPQILISQTWQNLIYSQEAKKQKIDVSDEEVTQQIRNIFKQQGVDNLTSDFYKRWLKSTLHLKPVEFEKLVRETIRIRKLIRGVASTPVDLPTEGEIFDRYQMDQTKLQFNVLTFDYEEDAKRFRSAYEQTKDLAQALNAEKPVSNETSEPLDIPAIGRQWSLVPSQARALYFLEEGALSQTLARNGKFLILRLVSKQVADKDSFTEEMHKLYQDELTQERREMMMMQWNLDLLERAQLKDFMENTPTAQA